MEELLGLLDRLTVILGELTAVQKDVAASVHEDDLIRLGECMKKEQALSLSLRNIDQKRLRLQQQMGLEKITLSALPADRIQIFEHKGRNGGNREQWPLLVSLLWRVCV